MSERESLLSQLEMADHAFNAARQNTAWGIAKLHAIESSHICRQLELLEMQEPKMADIKPIPDIMSADELARRLK